MFHRSLQNHSGPRGSFPSHHAERTFRQEIACRGEQCRHVISQPTFYSWKSKYAGLEVSEAKRLKALDEENRKLKKLLAEQVLDNATLKEMLTKNF